MLNLTSVLLHTDHSWFSFGDGSFGSNLRVASFLGELLQGPRDTASYQG